MKKILLLCAIFIAPQLIQAQKEFRKYEKEIEATVYAMAKAYEGLSVSKNKDRLLDYFTKDYLVDRVRITLDERVEVQTNNFVDLERLAQLLAETPNMEIHYTVDPIIKTYASPNVGYCIFEATYDFKKDGKPYVSGKETMTYYFQRVDQKWKVTRAHLVQVRERVNLSNCPCTVLKSSSTEGLYMAQIEVPSDTTFRTVRHNITFLNETNGMRLIDVDGTKYTWEYGGSVTVLPQGYQRAANDGGRVLGPAKKPIDVIRLILKEGLYPSNCSAVKIELKQ